MFNLRLLRSLVALALSSLRLMYSLELSEILKISGSLSWCFFTSLINKSLENTISKLDFALSQIIKNGVNARNNTTGIVQDTCLLHIEIIGYAKVTLLTIGRFIENLCVNDHGENGCWDKSKQVLFKSVDFSESPLLW